MSALKGVVIGAGDRGANAYVPHLRRNPEEGRVVAVVEPDVERRTRFAWRHGIDDAFCFADVDALFAAPPDADFAVITTPDSQHVEPALAALRQGWHVLLEKPMAVREADCRALVEAAESAGKLLQICHVLRYTELYGGIKDVIDSGEIGDVVTIQHSENVSYWHYAHSYCRGHWRNVAESSPLRPRPGCRGPHRRERESRGPGTGDSRP